MFHALRGRAGIRSLLSASTLPPPPRCVASAAVHRLLYNVADDVPTPAARKDDSVGPVRASTTAVGQEQDAAGAGGDSTETDEMADPRHILLYEGSKVHYLLDYVLDNNVPGRRYANFTAAVCSAVLHTRSLSRCLSRQSLTAIRAAAWILVAKQSFPSVLRSCLMLQIRVYDALSMPRVVFSTENFTCIAYIEQELQLFDLQSSLQHAPSPATSNHSSFDRVQGLPIASS